MANPIHDKIMEEKLTLLTQKVDKIHEALLGNEYNGGKGVVVILNDHERRIGEIETSNNTHKVYMGILKVIATILATGVLGLLINMFLINTKK